MDRGRKTPSKGSRSPRKNCKKQEEDGTTVFLNVRARKLTATQGRGDLGVVVGGGLGGVTHPGGSVELSAELGGGEERSMYIKM